MSDPYRNPPGTNPPRHVPPTNHTTAWTIVAIAVAVVAGVVVWEMTNREDRSARTEPDSTVGRSERLAPTPIPANPSGTQPQVDPRPDLVRPVPSSR
jgi:hypothetical protein